MTWRDGWYARWRGTEYGASPDGAAVRLYVGTPTDGFTEVAPGRYRRAVPAADVDLYYVRTRCTWRNEPFLVVGDDGDRLLLEYAGGNVHVAERLGLTAADVGVYWARVPHADVRDGIEERVAATDPAPSVP